MWLQQIANLQSQLDALRSGVTIAADDTVQVTSVSRPTIGLHTELRIKS